MTELSAAVSISAVLAEIASKVALLDGTRPGGALLGPRLLLAAAAGVSDADRLIRVGTAIELLRRATLVHRDPQAEANRPGQGAPALSGTLLGDMLFAESFRLLAEDGEPRLGTVLARAMAGVSESEMMAGAGPECEDRARRAASYFRGAAATGAIVAGLEASAVEEFADWGTAVGEGHERALHGCSLESAGAPALVSDGVASWVYSAMGTPDRIM